MYTDAQRRGNLQAGGAQVSPALDHTAYALYTVPQPAGGWPAVLRLDGELPAGVTGGFALVGRTGSDPQAGTVTKVVQQLPAGGAGSVQLPNPASFGRITAVLVNSDTDTSSFQGGDWVFSAEAQPFTAAAGVSAGVSQAPANTAPPTVSGVARDGSQLTAANGAWSGSAPMVYARQWRRCDSGGSACEDIGGATGARYTATEADIGHTLRVRVDASNGAGGAATAVSGPTGAVAATPIANTLAPTLSGDAVAGGELTAGDGSWTGSQPIVLSRRWQRCSSGPLTCADIPGEVGERYRLGLADVLAQVRVMVRASNAAGALEVPSALSARVRAASVVDHPPPPGPVATTATIKVPLKGKLASALAGKLAVTVQCSGACAATVRLKLTRAVARKLGVARVPARGSKRLAGAGRASVKLIFSAKARKKLRKARKLVGTLAVETRDASRHAHRGAQRQAHAAPLSRPTRARANCHKVVTKSPAHIGFCAPGREHRCAARPALPRTPLEHPRFESIRYPHAAAHDAVPRPCAARARAAGVPGGGSAAARLGRRGGRMARPARGSGADREAGPRV